jgi:hypothetical protein
MAYEKETIFGGRLSGASLVLGTIYSLVESEGDILKSILFGSCCALLGYIVGLISCLIFKGARESAKEFRSPFLQGAAFIFSILIGLGAFDLTLCRGIFIVDPIFQLVFSRSLQGTFWSCNNFVVEDEGSYCTDD